MELSFRDWVEQNEAVFPISMGRVQDAVMKVVTQFPILNDLFTLHGPPGKFRSWWHGFTVGRQAAKNDPNLTSQNNVFRDKMGNIPNDAKDFYNGWNDGIVSVLGMSVLDKRDVG